MQELAMKRSSKADEQRQRLCKDRQERKRRNGAWSSKTLQREQRDKRREKKGRKKAWAKAVQAPNTSAKEDEYPDGDNDGAEDWEDLKRENRLAKKAKRAGFVASEL